MLVTDDFKEFLQLLNAHNVRFLLVGGYAVGFHGYPRLTQDMDIFYEITAENARAVRAALDAFGFKSLGLTERDFLKEGQVIQLGHPPNRIDLINTITAVSFRTAWRSRVKGDYGGVVVYFIGRVPLSRNKRATGRDKDLVDVRHLAPKKKRASAKR